MELTPSTECDHAEGTIDWESGNTVYLLTWNPNGKIWPKNDNVSHRNKWSAMILKCLKYLHHCASQYCVVAEISHMGRLHCHGWFVIYDTIAYHKKFITALNRGGFYKIDKANCPASLQYYRKELDITTNILKQSPILSHLSYQTVINTLVQRIINKKPVQELKKHNILRMLGIISNLVEYDDDVNLMEMI